MRTLRTVGELRAAVREELAARPTLGLVPTMGALHQGHLSLIARAREQCDVVVVTLFVNPTQFGERADLEAYPRNEERDAELAQQAGADLLFSPAVQEIYPQRFSTTVEVRGLTEPLEGASRGPAHFSGVTTVVTKLLNIVGPHILYLGQKDAQQALVIRKLVEDLAIPVAVEVCPTVRERDGLACSSRNSLLNEGERARARALFAGLSAACGQACDGERSAQALTRCAREAMLAFDVEPEYLELVDPQTLLPIGTLDHPSLLAVAARVGSTRLIDNLLLKPDARAHLGVERPRHGPERGRRHRGASPNPRRKAARACSA